MSGPLTSFAHQLPYWQTSVGGTTRGPLPYLALFDGTIVCGYEVRGVDVYSSSDERLNAIAGRLRTALNGLPARAFIQTEWSVGHSHDDVLDDYQARCTAGPDLVRTQRAERHAFLRADENLRRGRMFFYVGLLQAFGPFTAIQGGEAPSVFARLFGRGRSGPHTLDEQRVATAVERLSEVSSRFMRELEQAGLSSAVLSEDGLIARIFETMNPISAPHTRPPRIVDRVDGEADLGPYLVSREFTLREQLPRGDLSVSSHHFTLDEPAVLGRALTLQSLPSDTTPDYMFKAQFALQTPFRIVTTCVATDAAKLTEQFLRRQRIATSETGGNVRNIAAEVALSDIQGLLQQMTRYDQRIFETSVCAVVTGESSAQLDRASSNMKEAFRSNADLTTEVHRQLPAFLSSLPGYGFSCPRTFRIQTNAAADLLPYFMPSSGDPEAQLVYHTRQGSLRKVSFAPTTTRPNRNALVFGPAGSGKSFALANIFEQAALADGAQVFIVDVQGPKVSNYKVLAELFGGTYVALSAEDASISLNPFPAPDEILVPDPADGRRKIIDPEQLEFLSRLLAVITVPALKGSSDAALYVDIAKEAIVLAYENVRSVHQVRTGTKAGSPPPTLFDVMHVLHGPQAAPDGAAAPAPAPADTVKHRYTPREPEYAALARGMYLQLQARLRNPRWRRLFEKPVSLRSSAQMQVFDFFGMERDEDLATALVMVVASYIWRSIQATPRDQTKFIAWDECWKLIGHPLAAETVAELFRTGRKWGASTWAVTQSLNDLLLSPVSSALLANASTIWLNRHAEGHDQVAEFCELNSRQAHLFRQLQFQSGQYSEMLFVDRAAGDATILRHYPTPYDLWLNTTSPADVALRDRIAKEEGLSIAAAVRACAARYPQGAPRG